ncbi:MAG: 3-dehydroquinate synthase, partial [Candidatus Omnitrophica bacterium]|nr:3-dehydroquinate synthase [Candidatus Omnitrophota bacterium]
HAIETAGGYFRYNHGEAVALGMLVAIDISRLIGLANEKAARRIDCLIQQTGLPHRIRGIGIDAIVKAHYHDKKFKGASNRFVLFKDIGKVMLVENVPLSVIKKAIKNRF